MGQLLSSYFHAGGLKRKRMRKRKRVAGDKDEQTKPLNPVEQARIEAMNEVYVDPWNFGSKSMLHRADEVLLILLY